MVGTAEVLRQEWLERRQVWADLLRQMREASKDGNIEVASILY